MKINTVTLAIAFAIAALSGYGLYAANGAETGGTLNIRLASGIFFVLTLVEQIVFCFVPFRLAPYIIVTGVLVLVYVLIVYGIGKAMR